MSYRDPWLSLPDDPYTILGVDPEADSITIRAAWREAARTHHPDRGGDPDVFNAARSAWEILSDEYQKSRYDNYKAALGQQQPPPAASPKAASMSTAQHAYSAMRIVGTDGRRYLYGLELHGWPWWLQLRDSTRLGRAVIAASSSLLLATAAATSSRLGLWPGQTPHPQGWPGTGPWPWLAIIVVTIAAAAAAAARWNTPIHPFFTTIHAAGVLAAFILLSSLPFTGGTAQPWPVLLGATVVLLVSSTVAATTTLRYRRRWLPPAEGWTQQ